MKPGGSRIAGSDKTYVSSRGTQKEPYFVGLGLYYFVYTRAFQSGVKLRRESAQRKKIASHIHNYTLKAAQGNGNFRVYAAEKFRFEFLIDFRAGMCYNSFYL